MKSIMLVSDDDLSPISSDGVKSGLYKLKSEIIQNEPLYDIVIYQGDHGIEILKNRFGKVEKLSLNDSISSLFSLFS